MLLLKLFVFILILGMSVVAGCGQALSGNNGTIQSPNYPNSYPNRARCVWTITTDPGTQVTLTFSAFDLERAYNCRYDSLFIYDGNSRGASRLGRLCGQTLPYPITASGNVMYIEFSTDGSVTRPGFLAQWSTHTVCGQDLTGNQGTLQSPNYPASYPSGTQCMWTITSEPGTQISLTFSGFDLQNTSGCQESLVIRDGNSQSAELLARMCGPDNFVSIMTSGNTMFVQFVSHGNTNGTGFQAHWSASQGGCGQALTGNEGTVQSPNFPYNYPNNARCVWNITADPGSQITLTFSDFHLHTSHDCSYDYLVIRDGGTETSNLFSKICGMVNPFSLQATGNTMFIEFHSNWRTTRSGFHARWSTQVCGQALTGNEGTLQSPNYPNNYTNNAQCVWTITTDPGTQVVLSVSAFDLQDSSFCPNRDSLVIRDGSNHTANVLSTLCGSGISAPIMASGNFMFLHFTTDDSITASGFQAQWTTNQGCGQALTGNNGTLQSPNYPYSYPNNARCVWTITTDPDTKVVLSFSYFNLQYSSECRDDYLVVRDGSTATSALLSKTCGFRLLAPLTASGNVLHIEFYSNTRTSNLGFQAEWSAQEDCGAALTGNTGTLQSPNYPNNYPSSAYCIWTITSDPGTQVQLRFSTFDLQHSSSCQSDALVIQDSNSSEANTIGPLCGSDYRHFIFGSQNKLYIYFLSDATISGAGFQAEWSTRQGCGEALTGNNGTLISPNYPYNYPNNVRCMWTITADPDSKVLLTFSYFSLEYDYGCDNDYMLIHDGSNQYSSRLARLCSSYIRQPIRATGNVMFIEFQTNSRTSYGGFQAQWYSQEECGGALSGNTGTLQSPNYPNNYSSFVYCEWTIITDPGTKVQLTFSAFHLQNSSYCSSSVDSVTIRDGRSSTASFIGRLCGSGYSDSILAAGNTLYILFTSDERFSASGFQAQWSINQGCGQALTGNNGTLKSPNYPYNYPNNARCVWTITTDPDTRVMLTFSYFQLEYGYDCAYDFLVIRDGSDPTSNVLQRLCGSSTPETIVSTGNVMFIEFQTNYRRIYKGFQAQWYSREVCGSALSGNNGTFQSPNYPNNYPNNVYCEWTIRTDVGTKVQLTFSAFELHNSYYCSSSIDSVTIRDGSNSTAGLIGRLCGSGYSDSIVTSGNSLYILFTSDNSFSLSGFQGQWSINQGCGQALFGNNGTLESPNYPYNYPNNARCVWTITTDPDTRVVLTFSYFRLEYDYGCDDDSLVIRDGSDPTSTTLRRLCGSSTPQPIRATGNIMFIEFKTDYRTIYKGFQARWESQEVCGSALSGNNGTFQSPNYPNNYPNNVYCEWTIRTDLGTKVQLTFSAFELQNSYYCSSSVDSVTIHDGSNSTAGFLGRLCGSGYSDSIVASSNSLYILFTSDNSFSLSGFQAQWSINQGCGQALTGNNGTLKSPNYPYNYPNDARCVWTITTDPDTRVMLTFSYFRLEYGYECDYDFLVIRDGSDPTSNVLQRLCGSSTPETIISTGNVMFIEFQTNYRRIYKGFQAQWYSREVCGSALSGNNGTFQSPNYPNNYPNNAYCEWTIRTDPGTKVQLTFSAFELENSYYCSSRIDSVTIRDGSNSTAGLIGRLCGSGYSDSIVASGNSLYIFFTSDNSFSISGFQAQWSINHGCGEALTGNNGTIQSPNYPYNYPNNIHCEWTITADPGQRIILRVPYIGLQYHYRCDYDSIAIYDGMNQTSRLLSKICGSSSPGPIVSTENVMFIKFRSNFGYSYRGRGFHAQWLASEGCGEAMIGNEGTFQSPNYHNRSTDVSFCEWAITTEVGSKVVLSFSAFSLGSSYNCDAELYIYDGNNATSRTLRR